MVQPLHIRGASLWDRKREVLRDLYTSDVVMDKPASNALAVDLEGYAIFPGLINAHDHLELNHYPRTKFREKYDNARQWSADVNERLDTEPYKSLRAYPLEDRCFIGGLKNLLCGATTVAHHNPPHKCLFRKDFPVRVLRKYGWAHSFYLSSDEEIVRSYRSIPSDVPWFIHLAEGTDEEAAGEYQRLKAMGCVEKNAIIVHGVGLRKIDREHAFHNSRGLVICPSTNQYMLGKTHHQLDSIEIWSWTDFSMALGSDSRLTSDGDFLDEIRFTYSNVMSEDTVLVVGIYYDRAYQLLDMAMNSHLIDDNLAGNFRTGSYPDFIAIKHGANDTLSLCQSHRADLSLVVKGGVPQIGDPEMMAKFPYVETVDATLDGKPKSIHLELARRIQQCSLKEPGLKVDKVPERTMFGFIMKRNDARKRVL